MTLDAWNKYVVWSREIIEKAQVECGASSLRVLKTDLNNEAHGDDDAPGYHVRPVIPAIADMCDVSCIEVDQLTIDRASEKFSGIDAQQGSVSNLPYENDTFDVVLDLSTIDHIEDYGSVLDEYRRVLKPHGMALIVVWLDDYNHTQEYPIQFWFDAAEFSESVNSRFEVIENESFNHVNGVPYPGRLAKFVVRKTA